MLVDFTCSVVAYTVYKVATLYVAESAETTKSGSTETKKVTTTSTPNTNTPASGSAIDIGAASPQQTASGTVGAFEEWKPNDNGSAYGGGGAYGNSSGGAYGDSSGGAYGGANGGGAYGDSTNGGGAYGGNSGAFDE